MNKAVPYLVLQHLGERKVTLLGNPLMSLFSSPTLTLRIYSVPELFLAETYTL